MKLALSPKSFYALTGVVVVIGLGLMWMSYTSITDQKAHIETMRKELRDEKEVQTELAEAKKKVDDLKFKLNHLEEGVQQFAYIPTMLKELEQFGKKNNLQIIQVKPIPAPQSPNKDVAGERTKAPYQELNVNVKGRGSYEDCLRFLQAIKVFPKIVAVRTVSLQPRTDNSSNVKKSPKPVLEFDLELRAYAFKEEKKEDEPKTASKDVNGGKDES